jgi:heat shock protein HtpX
VSFAATARTTLLMSVLIGLFVLAGWVVAGFGLMGDPVAAMVLFGVIAVVFNGVAFLWGHKFVLWSYKARIVGPHEAPRLHAIVEKVRRQANLPMPTVAIIPMQVPNAFATGRSPKKAVVAATEGIMAMLDDDELEGVMAHEMAHVGNRDMLVMSLAATIAGAITFAARMLFWNALFGGGDNRNPIGIVIGLAFMVLAPFAALLVQMAVSRQREYKADAVGARNCRKPWALARALEKMDAVAKGHPIDSRHANPSTASLFIVNPFRSGAMSRMFSTHPPTEERVRRLKNIR